MLTGDLEGSIEYRVLSPNPRVSIYGVWVEIKNLYPNKFFVDADVAGLGITLGGTLPYIMAGYTQR